MSYKRIISPGFAQTPSLKRVLDGGFTQLGKFRPVMPGGWADAGNATPQPPSVAPILMVDAEIASFVANLAWTASNRTGSPGFTYEVWMKVDAGSFAFLASTTNLFLNTDQTPTIGVYAFEIRPRNDAGYGPSSNIGSTQLPGGV